MRESPSPFGHLANVQAGPPGPEPKRADWRRMKKLGGRETETEAITMGVAHEEPGQSLVWPR